MAPKMPCRVRNRPLQRSASTIRGAQVTYSGSGRSKMSLRLPACGWLGERVGSRAATSLEVGRNEAHGLEEVGALKLSEHRISGQLALDPRPVVGELEVLAIRREVLPVPGVSRCQQLKDVQRNASRVDLLEDGADGLLRSFLGQLYDRHLVLLHVLQYVSGERFPTLPPRVIVARVSPHPSLRGRDIEHEPDREHPGRAFQVLGQCHLAKVDLFFAACRSVVFWLVAGMIAAYGRQWRSGCGRSADGLGVCRRAGHVRAAGCGR